MFRIKAELAPALGDSKMPSNPLKIAVSDLHSQNQKRARVTCKAPYVGSIPARASNPKIVR